MSVLGDNLKKRRLELDITQAEIAAKINKAPETYCRYEAGTLKPDIDTLLLIAEAYEITLDELTGRDLVIMAKAMYRLGYKAGDQLGEKIERKRATKRTRKKPATDTPNE